MVVLFTLEVRIIVVLLLSSVFRLLVGFLLVMLLKELRLLILDVRAGRLWDAGLRTLKSWDSTEPLARLLLRRGLCLWMRMFCRGRWRQGGRVLGKSMK